MVYNITKLCNGSKFQTQLKNDVCITSSHLDWTGLDWTGLDWTPIQWILSQIYAFWVESIWTMGGAAKYCPKISGTWPGLSTLWLQYNHLLEHEILKGILPIGYTTVCCSYIECEHQFALRTAINCSCWHVREGRGSGKPWTTGVFLAVERA